jgi:hypothetical protein
MLLLLRRGQAAHARKYVAYCLDSGRFSPKEGLDARETDAAVFVKYTRPTSNSTGPESIPFYGDSQISSRSLGY